MRLVFVAICVLLFGRGFSQTHLFTGTVIDEKSGFPVEGASVVLQPTDETVVTDERGRFTINMMGSATTINVTSVGYETNTLSLQQFKGGGTILLHPKTVVLTDVTVTAGGAEQYRSISRIDINLRGINNSQEVLRMVPGLFIGQHAGGGKAEQIFLRGFDEDHGTDINISVDGSPVNMVSHAHGQGYADLHFVIPELIENVNFKKGPYYPEKGNFTTTGFVDLKTLNTLPNSTVKVEAGMFNTLRTVAMLNLLPGRVRAKGQSAYIASEYMYSRGYFDHTQDFNRFNLFGKYGGTLDKHTALNLTASTFYSKWNASGQLPDRAVESGIIGFYGAIDPTEGGMTARTNVNTVLTTTLNNGGYLKNQVYFTDYRFTLYSNFTFFKEDSVNGDQIRQKEHRYLYGYNSSYNKTSFLRNTQVKTEIGVNARFDRVFNSELSRTKDRNLVTQPLTLGDIAETNLGAYLSEMLTFSPKFTANAGARYDYFFDRYIDKLNNNKKGDATAGILCPKLSFFYQASGNTQLYLSSGRGFHSNDTRVVVPQNGLKILPPAYGTDLGTVLKPAKNLLVNAAVWYLWLDQEFVYSGDEGVAEPSGRTKRYGTDFSVRYQPLSWLYLHLDWNYSHARFADGPKGRDYVPLAPLTTSIGGVTVKTKGGISTSLRYRYMGDRPATEDNAVVAKGYFVTDGSVTYRKQKYEIGLSIQNLFNIRWKETQFYTECRLQHEPAPVSEIHFTPGTPFFAKLSFTCQF